MADGYDAGHPYNNEPHKIKNLLRTYLHLRYLRNLRLKNVVIRVECSDPLPRYH